MSRQSCNLDFDGCDRSIARVFPRVLFSPSSFRFLFFFPVCAPLTTKIPSAYASDGRRHGAARRRAAGRPSIEMLISQAPGVPYRDKGTTMTGFKDWLTQISGAICHAPTGRRRRRRCRPVATPAHLRRRRFCLASPLLRDASSVPYRFAGLLLSSARQTPLNSKVNCEIGILRGKRSPNLSNPPVKNFSHHYKVKVR